LAEEFSRLSGYGLEEVPEESSYAGYKDWFIQSFRRPGFTVEVGSGINPLPLSQFDEIYRDNLGILTTAALGLPQS
jgi:g-D-glutamyl-meso-diaminopimelate peptidase